MQDDSVPEGKDETRMSQSAHGVKQFFDFTPKRHWEKRTPGELDSERAIKITGARLVLYKGLERF
jgi:seryl-tRNA synthetase